MADLIENAHRYDGIYFVVFPIHTVVTAVKVMCEYSAGVLDAIRILTVNPLKPSG
jgi:hypothetical protein